MKMRLLAALAAVAAAAGGTWWGLQPAHPQPAALGSHSDPVSQVAPARVSSPGPGWHLAFEAGFPGSELDRSQWATCFPWVAPDASCTNFGNTEYQWFTPAQDRVSGGVLHLVAQHVPTSGRNAHGGPQEYPCRSGMVTTYPSFRFTYGYLQVVARVPEGPGLWSGLWLAAASRRWPPEIDVLENWGAPADHAGVYLHPLGGPWTVGARVPGDFSAGWHTFGLYWSSSRLIWFVDGRAVYTVSQYIPHQSMYFIADLADSRLPAGACNGDLLIRSVKIWQTAKK